MPFAVKVGDVLVRLDDVPGHHLDEIGARHDVKWFDILNAPASTVALGLDVIRLGYTIAGKPVPETIADWTPKQILGAIEIVKDDLPASFEDGLPKEADVPETTS